MRKMSFIILLFLSSISFGQKFTLSELIKATSMNSDDFDTYVTNKGYHFGENRKSEYSKGIKYEYDGKICRSEFSISKNTFNNGEVLLTYHTLSKSEYLTVKSQLKALGFKFIETKNEDDAVWFCYEKNKLRLTLISSEAIATTGQSLGSGYEISIANMP
jgi:hypothetical protein